MGQVISLSDFRKPEKAPQVDAPAPDPGPSYYCTRCDADRFTLCTSGLVRCAGCGAVMRNILVADSTKPRQGQEQ